MTQLEELKVKLSADAKKFKDGMKEASSSLGEFKNLNEKTGVDVGKTMTAVGAGMTVAGTAIVGTLGAIGVSAINSAKEIDKFAKMSGMSGEEVQRLDGVMQACGWSFEQAGGDMAMFSERMLDASQGAGDAGDFFKKLGVDVTNQDGSLRSANDTFVDTIKALQNVENETERAAISTALLGTTGEELSSIFGLTNEELDKMLGSVNVVDDDTIEKAKSFGMQWELVKYNLSQTAMAIGAELLPVIQPLIEKIMEVAQNVSAWVQKNPELVQAILAVVGGIGALMLVLGPIIMLVGGLTIAISLFNASMLPIIGTILLVGAGIVALIAIGVLLYKNWDELKAKATELKDEVIKKFNEIKDKVTDAITGLKENTITKFNEIKDGIIEKIVGAKDQVLTDVKTFISNLEDKWDEIKTSASRKWDEIKQAIIDKIVDAKDGVVEKFNTVKGEMETIWGGVTDFLSGIDLFTIGSNIVGGLVRGIKSCASSVRDALGGIVDSAISNVKKALGISSPSKLFKKFGAWTSEGFAIGIESKTMDVRDASKGLSLSAVGGYFEGLSNSNSKSTNATTNNITINASQPLNPSQVAKETLKAQKRLALGF